MTNRQNIKKTAELAILTAIVIVFQLLGSFIPVSYPHLDVYKRQLVNYVINTRDYGSADMNSDGNMIRRCAVENNVTVFTSLDTVRALLDVLEEITMCVSTIDAK